MRCTRCLSSDCCWAASCMALKRCSAHSPGAEDALSPLLLGHLMHRVGKMLTVYNPSQQDLTKDFLQSRTQVGMQPNR